MLLLVDAVSTIDGSSKMSTARRQGLDGGAAATAHHAGDETAETNIPATFDVHDKQEKQRQRKSQGGPTTEAGKQKQADAMAAKRAKLERKREKNRRKRQAYRSRKRIEKPNQRLSSSLQWKKYQREQEEAKKRKKEQRKKEAKDRKKAEKKQRKKKERDQRQSFERMSEEEWEKYLNKALEKENFTELQDLFLADLHSHATRQTENDDPSVKLSKRYRTLSQRFHPDKQQDASKLKCYKIAFQALNEAHQESREQFAVY